MSLLDARGWLNDRLGRAVRVETVLELDEGGASPILSATGMLLHWRDRFPDALASDPDNAVAWYAIGLGEDDPINYIKTSFNLSLLPDDTEVVSIANRIDLRISESVWLCITQVGDSLS